MSKVIKQMEMADLKRTFASVRDLVVLHVNKLSCQADTRCARRCGRRTSA
jgi:hypothetical protein